MRKYCTYYIKQIHDYIEKRANNELRTCDLTLAQHTVLFLLMNTSFGQLEFKALEKELGVAQSTTVGIIERLAQKGFVEKIDSVEDRRIKIVRITEQGKSAYKTTQIDMNAGENDILKGLTGVEKEEFWRLLNKVCKTIE